MPTEPPYSPQASDPSPETSADALDLSSLPDPEEGSSLGAEWGIAWSHLRSKKSETFLSVVTLFSILGVTAGVAILNIVIAVMTGFEVELRDKILGANAHVVVFSHGGNLRDYDETIERIDRIDGVQAAAPFVYTEMMIRSPWASTGIVVKGIDVERTGEVTHVRDDLVEGYLYLPASEAEDGEDRGPMVGALEDPEPRHFLFEALDGEFPPVGIDKRVLRIEDEPDLPGIVIGVALQEQLKIRVGDKIQLINPLGSGSAGPMGMPMPTVRSVRLAGVFDSGMYEYDNKWTYLTNTLAQDFLKIGDTVTAIEVKVHDIDGAERVAEHIEAELGYPHYTRHWKNLNAKLFEALQLEKFVMGLLLQMVVFVAGLLIITTLFMLVLTKGREIAILKAMGATNGSILRIFIMQGSVIGLLGTTFGTIVGLIGCAFLREYSYGLDTDVYLLSSLPVVVDPAAVTVIAISAFVICFLCTIYPARRAASLDPIEALRYE